MPAPINERQRLEHELAELPEQIAAYQRELDATPIENRGRREMREWQIRRAQKRLAAVEAWLVILAEQERARGGDR